MERQSEYMEDLKVIKKVMEESSRFLSLSGLSGLFTGLVALAGALIAVFMVFDGKLVIGDEFISNLGPDDLAKLRIRISLIAVIVLIVAIGIGLWFSYRKSVKKNLNIWTPVSRRFLANLLVPLITGGILILIFSFQDLWQLIIPSMLIFYGLALVGAGRFTYADIFYLGVIEIITGLAATVFPSLGILFWCFGFSLLHIIYGLMMYRKYER